jgi:hypothetical protein
MTTRTKKHTLSLYLPEHQGVSIDALTYALLPHAGHGSNQAFVFAGAVLLWNHLYPAEGLPELRVTQGQMPGTLCRRIADRLEISLASVVQTAIAMQAGKEVA